MTTTSRTPRIADYDEDNDDGFEETEDDFEDDPVYDDETR